MEAARRVGGCSGGREGRRFRPSSSLWFDALTYHFRQGYMSSTSFAFRVVIGVFEAVSGLPRTGFGSVVFTPELVQVVQLLQFVAQGHRSSLGAIAGDLQRARFCVLLDFEQLLEHVFCFPHAVVRYSAGLGWAGGPRNLLGRGRGDQDGASLRFF